MKTLSRKQRQILRKQCNDKVSGRLKRLEQALQAERQLRRHYEDLLAECQQEKLRMQDHIDRLLEYIDNGQRRSSVVRSPVNHDIEDSLDDPLENYLTRSNLLTYLSFMQ